ncbi:MAG: acyltransferase [Xanthomonadales bacterium]|nr:acyltransferase [Xanthomonadales bacterium]
MNDFKPASARRTSSYLPYIDGLRAIAVIAVMIYHLRETWVPGGFIGVDVFFVISGFVVSLSVSHWSGGNIGNFMGRFYARRVQRIVPALLACLLLTSVVSVLLIPRAWLSSSNELTGMYAFFGLSNYFLAFHNETYFSPIAAFNPYMHTWSLGVEEQFYLLFPLLFFAWTRGGRWRAVSTTLITLACLASLTDAWQRPTSDPTAAFYLITTRFWELAAGVLLFQGLQRFPDAQPGSISRNLSQLAALTSIGLLGWGLLHSDISQFPWPGAVVPIVATLGVLAFLHFSGETSTLARILGSAVPVYFGRRSYSLYLWHWPVYVVMRWTCGLDSSAAMIAAIAATMLLAEASYRFVELPLRYSERLRHWPRAGVVSAGLALVVTTSALSAAVTLARAHVSLSTVSRHPDHWYAQVLDRVDSMPGCFLMARDEGSGPTVASIYSRGGCSGRPQTAPDILALGDSHTLGYKTMLTEYVLHTGAQVTLYPNIGCTFASLKPWRDAGECQIQNQAEIGDIRERAKAGDVLFLASLRLDRLSNQDQILVAGDQWHGMATEQAEQDRLTATKQLIAMLEPLRDKGVQIVFEAPKPLFRSPAFRCSDWFNRINPICAAGLSESRAAIEAYRQPVVDSLVRLASALGGSVWDPLPILCTQDQVRIGAQSESIVFRWRSSERRRKSAAFPSFLAFIAALPERPAHGQPVGAPNTH